MPVLLQAFDPLKAGAQTINMTNLKINERKFGFGLLSIVIIAVFTGCATHGPTEDYQTLLSKSTQSKKVYDGLVEVLEYNSVFLSHDLAVAQVKENSRIYQYSDSQLNNELATSQANLSKQAEFFLSIYVTETKYDDLAKKNTKWKIFLDVDGKRYEAKAIKVKNQLVDIQSLYPFHNKFTSAYRLLFPVPTETVETHSSKLTLTGPVTSLAIDYDNGRSIK